MIAEGAAETSPASPALRWWERRSAVAALILISMIPLLWPGVPPLLDLPGHMGRYAVQLHGHEPPLRDFYTFEWRLIGNLGIDLLIMPLAPIFGLELAVKLIVVTIPALTVAGFLWVAREVHGRIPPTAMLAVPFAYNFPFLFGFVNYALSMALAFLAFGLWLRLARLQKTPLRAAVMVPLSILLWICHAFGWGTLGVLAFSAELVRQFDRGQGLVMSGVRAGIHCLSLAPPMILMLLWRGEGSGGQTGDWLNFDAKLEWLRSALRDRWELFDTVSLALCGLVIFWAMVSRRIHFSRNLAASALFLSIVFIVLPRIVFGSAYADMRLAPYLFAVGLIAIRFPEGTGAKFMKGLALASVAFVLVRTSGTTASMILYDRSFDRELAALEHVPRGARMVSFVGRNCREPWGMSRLLHVPGLAMVRRHAFSNDQWTMAGAQLLNVRYRDAFPFMRDPTQVVTPRPCGREVWRSMNEAMAHFPRDAFDYVWTIDPPRFDPAFAEDLQPIWQSGTSRLYRVMREPADKQGVRRTPSAG
jgi:hypothetical protein